MRNTFLSLVKKDFQMMLSSKFLLLAVGSLFLYSCYINFVYVKLDQEVWPVYLYDAAQAQTDISGAVIRVDSRERLQTVCADGYSVGIDVSGEAPELFLVSSGSVKTDRLRAAYAFSLLEAGDDPAAVTVGSHNREMKSRREITSEFLFFELAAVGFLGLASMLFKEKQMGVIRVHGILPVNSSAFILSKLGLLLLSDLAFAALLTFFNLGPTSGLAVLPGVLVQTGILSMGMALVGFYCAIRLPDFKQFSLLYLVLAVFISTPVFLVGQTGVDWDWIHFHPMYHLFMAMKNAYFGMPAAGAVYYLICGAVLALLFLLARRALVHEMAKEG